jgi:hypothetical protein
MNDTGAIRWHQIFGRGNGKEGMVFFFATSLKSHKLFLSSALSIIHTILYSSLYTLVADLVTVVT